ncbi:DNA cytosine methyltransferase [Sphingorhabdus sp.]|uniref:DNA cytosine methyltransferase n=1 Tax=Sphingorhabdus sp. TaxID=1902408 RepID=UPI002C4FBBE5|nr:DNA cytosine methyltransferase [Sphingorhabdus sp.]HMT41957.1 DNA cytosine methyltransferase [Sphingorhabdus sp.]
MARPIGIDLFAGAGGMSLGFEQAGFDVIAAVEIDPVHCAVHKYNFPNCAILPRSVVGLSGNEIRVAAGIGKRKVDVVFGGAPCQGFSMIGQRAFDDPRNSLVRDFLRIVWELDASYFVFENVKGLTLGNHRKFLDEIVATADELGYDVLVPWQVLDAANFGVPQHRERLILFGAQRPRKLPCYPAFWSKPADRKGKVVAHCKSGPTVSDALDDLPDADLFEMLRETDEVRPEIWGSPSSYAKELRCLANDSWHYGYVRNWDSSLLTSSFRTDHTAISRRRFSETKGGTTEPISRFYKLAPDGLSNTLRAGTDGARGAFTSPRPIHHKHDRCVTVREMARLHGYPDWFRFNETKWHGARQIGNSVPPPLARAVAERVMRALEVKPERPFETVDLGVTDLLRMTVSQAARHFQVEAPPSKRDRKSGAKKRKQLEIEEARMLAYG